MYVNNIEPEMFLPPGSESFNHNATRTTSSRSRSNNVNNNIVPVYMKINCLSLSENSIDFECILMFTIKIMLLLYHV